MKITETKITVRDLTTNYKDDTEHVKSEDTSNLLPVQTLGIAIADDEVVGYGGNLNIRPAYQREFVYNAIQRNAVIDTIIKGYPLGIMYWADLGGGKFEVIDGQQRTLSICQFVAEHFSVRDSSGNALNFTTFSQNKQDEILNYALTVYQCEGTPEEKLAWFTTINIAGLKLTDQELRNPIYIGPWLSDAKRHFSAKSCGAVNLGSKYINADSRRQEYLEIALDWISNGDITGYMAKHQHDKDAKELWDYFQAVMKWVKATFTDYHKEMKGINWGVLYNAYKDGLPDPSNSDPAAPKIGLDPVKIKGEVAKLRADEEVSNKKGIYSFILTRKERKLHLRSFEDNDKITAFQKQGGVCPKCQKVFKIEEMEADHINPWSKGGKTILTNLQMLCKEDNRLKSGI